MNSRSRGRLDYKDFDEKDFDESKNILIVRNDLKLRMDIDLMEHNNAMTLVNMSDLRTQYPLYWAAGAHGADVYLINLDEDGDWVTIKGKKLKTNKEKSDALNAANEDPLSDNALDCVLLGEMKSVQIDRDTILELLRQKLEFNSIVNYFIDEKNRNKTKIFIFTVNRSDNFLKSISFVLTDKRSIEKLTNILDASKALYDYLRKIYSDHNLFESGKLFSRLTLPVYFWMLCGKTRITVKNQMGDWNSYNSNLHNNTMRQTTFDAYIRRDFSLSKREYLNILRDYTISLSREYNNIYDTIMGKLLKIGKVENGVFMPNIGPDGYRDKSFNIGGEFYRLMHSLFSLLDVGLSSSELDSIIRNPDKTLRSYDNVKKQDSELADNKLERRFYSHTGEAYDRILATKKPTLSDEEYKQLLKDFNKLTSFEERKSEFEKVKNEHDKKKKIKKML